jgi:hypothetical protein
MRACLAVLAVVPASLYFAPAAVRAGDDAAKAGANDDLSLAEQIRGEWVLYRDTPNGRYMTIKEHLGERTVVTTYDPENRPVLSHRSEYRVDAGGSVPIFQYRNKVVLVGPNAGATDESESAYIFRVEGDRFYEVHGMLPGDTGKPSLVVWERLKGNPIPKPKPKT